MSAIFGLFHLDGRNVAADDLARMNTALSAHGPDGNDTWQQGNVGLGQRLMCFTPEDRFEQQPLKSRDGQRILVSDARIDNRPELMKEFGINQAEANQLPDSAFIMHAYEKWGEDCASHLIGAFAFALWDEREKKLLLACSRMRERMIYYYSTPNCFVFSSMPKGLFSLPFMPRAIDEERLADLLLTQGVGFGNTFYRNIHCLKAGHYLVVRQEGYRQQRYWSLEPGYELRFKRDEEYVEAFNELFERVVADHLRSLTPVGIMMSGGLDSSSVAATAAPILAKKNQCLSAFTEVPREGFDGPIIKGRYANETPFVQAIAGMYDNLDLNLVRTDGRFYLEDIDSVFDGCDDILIVASNLTWWESILAKAGERGIGVMLNGTSGNMSISWSGSDLLTRLVRKGKWLRALQEAKLLHMRSDPRSTLRILFVMGVMPWLPDLLYKGIYRLSGRKPTPMWNSSSIRSEFALEQKVYQRMRELGHADIFRIHPDMRKLRSEHFLSGGSGPGSYWNGSAARFGVDMRDPTGDSRLVEFCLSVPEEQYLREGQSRWLIRRAMEGRLPQVVLDNKKRGLQCADWYERLYQARDDILQKLDQFEQCELANRAIDISRMRDLIKDMPEPGHETQGSFFQYRNVVENCLMTGSFLQWFEAGA